MILRRAWLRVFRLMGWVLRQVSVVVRASGLGAEFMKVPLMGFQWVRSDENSMV